MGRRVPRTRNGEQWTEARFFGFLRSSLRSAFQKWGPKHEAKRQAKVAYNSYKCAACGEAFASKEVEVDIVPAGSLKTFDDLLDSRSVCSARSMGFGACKECHQAKTNKERKR